MFKKFIYIYLSLIFFTGCNSNNELQKINSVSFDEVGMYNDGMYPVKLNSMYGYMNQVGEIKIDFQYEQAYTFSDGLANVMTNGNYGAIDKENNFIIPPIYKKITYCKYGVMGALNKENFYTLIDKQGNLINDQKYELILNQDILENNSSNDIHTINIGETSLINDTKNYMISSTTTPYFLVKQNGKYGYIDYTGKAVVDIIYDKVSTVNNDKIVAMKNGKLGCLDVSGKEIFSFAYDEIKFLSNEYYLLTKENKTVIVDNKKNIQFNSSESLFYIGGNYVKNSKNKIFNFNGEEIVLNTNEDISSVYGCNDNNYIIACNYVMKYGLFDSAGNELLPVKFAMIKPDDNHFIVYNYNEVSIYNLKIKKILKLKKCYLSVSIGDYQVFENNDGTCFLMKNYKTILIKKYKYITLYKNSIIATNQNDQLDVFEKLWANDARHKIY